MDVTMGRGVLSADVLMKYTAPARSSAQASDPAPVRARGGDKEALEDHALREACRELESFFLEQLIKGMRSTLPDDGLFGGGRGEELFQSLLDAEIARKMAARGGVGLADVLYDQLSVNMPEPAR